MADGLAELQVAFPGVPIVFCETRRLAEEWTYRFLATAHAAAGGHDDQDPVAARDDRAVVDGSGEQDALAVRPTTAEVRSWAREHGLDVPDRGRLRPEIWVAYRHTHE